MTAIQTGTYNTLSVNMADDDVGLSSEHLEHAGNDDIDIDIDLLTAQQDEDFILEDVETDRSLEDAAVGNDDIMQDEENASYQMDDVDILQDEHVENLQMEDAYQSKAPGADFFSTEMGHNQGDVPENYIGLNGASEAAMDDLTNHATFFREVEDEQVLEVHGVSDTDLVKTRKTEIFELPPQLPVSEESLTSEGQPEGQLLSVGPRTTSPKGTEPSVQDQTGHGTVSGLVDPIAQGQDGVDPAADQERNVPQLRVIVLWRDAEYDLTAVSDGDDPDSFFLQDVKLIKEPFPSFLAALREVVLDELDPEDELCLTIEDLGLEVSEVSLLLTRLFHSELILLVRRLQLSNTCLSRIFWIFTENFCEMMELR